MNHMKQYLLLDGALTTHSSAKEALFGKATADWCQPLLDIPNLRLLSPILIDVNRVEQYGGSLQNSLRELLHACPMQLHLSYLESNLELGQIAKHLSRFTSFYDAHMQLYGVRLADCRVLVVLAEVLTKQQWTDLTDSISSWSIHNRKGESVHLPVATNTTQPKVDQVFTLTVNQVDALVRASEPDALLSHHGLDLNVVKTEAHNYWVWAKTCLQVWQQSKSTDREVLNAFARLVFNSKGKALQERQWQAFLATATVNDFAK